jgi:hypothetical protein
MPGPSGQAGRYKKEETVVRMSVFKMLNVKRKKSRHCCEQQVSKVQSLCSTVRRNHGCLSKNLTN